MPSQLNATDASRFIVPVGNWDKQNAVFTLVSLKTSQRFTYRIQAPKKQDNDERPVLFVHLLTGPNNTSDYAYLGLIVNPLAPKAMICWKFRYPSESFTVSLWS